MFIRNCLTPIRQLEILKTGMTIGDALNRMNEVLLFSLPVVDEESNFVGILSKQSMFQFLESQPDDITFADFRSLTIDNCIDKEITSVDIDKDHFEDCLPVIVRHPFVPVVRDGTSFVGIVKRSAIERALNSSFGSDLPGVRYMIAVHDTEGTLLNIARIVYRQGINIISAISFEAGETFVRRILLKVEPNDKVKKLAEEIESRGYRVLEITES